MSQNVFKKMSKIGLRFDDSDWENAGSVLSGYAAKI